MENNRRLLRMIGWGTKIAIKEGFLLVAIGVVICVCLDTWNQIPFLWTSKDSVGVLYYWFNAFSWGGFYSIYIIPMLSCIPYATSFCEEYNSNMVNVLVSKTNIRMYCASKVITTAISGGVSLAMGGSLFVFLASRLTILVDKNTLMEYQGLPYYTFIQEGSGIKYFVVAIFLLFLSGVLWSSTGLLVSAYIRDSYVVFVAPFIASFFLVRINDILKVPVYLRLNLLLHARSTLGTDMQTILMISLTILIIVIIFGFLFYRKVRGVIKNG